MVALVLPGLNGGLIVAGRSGFTTFNPANKSANIDLSNGNLTATSNVFAGPASTVRSIAHHDSLVRYCEITLGGGGGAYETAIGLCDALWPEDDSGGNLGGAGYAGRSIGFYRGDPNVYLNNASLGNTGITYGGGDRIGVEFDPTNRTIRFRQNGGTWSSLIDISTMVDTDLYLIVELLNFNEVTANFGATAYVDTPPVGASNW